MHCIFWSLYIIFNIVHDNQRGKPWEIKGRLLVYTVLYVKQCSVNMNWLSMKKFVPLSPLVSWWVADVCDHQMTWYNRQKRYWQYPNHNKIANFPPLIKSDVLLACFRAFLVSTQHGYPLSYDWFISYICRRRDWSEY